MKSLNFERGIKIILGFQLIEASVRANRGRKLGAEGVYPKAGRVRGRVLRLSERVGGVAIESLSKANRETS